ncbi:acyl-CoA thioesterase [Glycocaulis sp.]
MSSKPEAPRRADFTFFHPLRVRWAETDPQGIVFNGHYFLYFDVALTEFWRAAGIDIINDLASGEGESFAVSAQADYYAPAVFDEMIDIGVRLERVGTSSLTFRFGIFRGEQILTGGRMIYAWATRAEPRTPCAPPADFLEKLRRV